MHKKIIYLVALVSVLSIPLVETAQAELVGRWRFDEGSGTTAFDSSGNGNDGTLVGGATWTAGRFDGGLELDGTSGYVSVPNFELTTNSITFAIWVNGWKGGDWAPLISSRVVGQCEMIFSDDDTLRYVWNNDSSATWAWTGGPVIPQDTWTMLAVTIDPDRAVAFVYTDADGLTSATNEIPHIEETVGALQIGWSYGNRFVRGIIDEAAVYDHALTEDEIMAVVKGEGLPHAIGPKPSDGSILMDTWVSLSWRPGDYAVSHDVYLGDNPDEVSNATPDSDVFRGNQIATFFVAGFPGFPYPDGLVPGTTYYWRIDEVNETNPESPWKGDIWSFSIPPKTAYNPDPADGTEIADANSATLSWTPGFGAILHTVYFGDDYDEVNNATVGVTAGTASYSPDTLEREKVYYWRVDEFDAVATHKGDVWSFTTPGAVGNPQPAYGATDMPLNMILSWTPADSAASHQFYFGTDKEAVRTASIGSPEDIGSKALGAENYDPGLLDADTTYYWRVDEVDDQGNTAKGPLWIFTTGGFLLIEDFEGYTDDDAAGQAIWQTWIDGFGIPDNGAQVGYLMPPYAEQTIVHGGLQSMPLLYANEAGVTNSEGSMALTAPRDWIPMDIGIAELSLWFRGDLANAAEPLYVAISNTAGAPGVIAHDDPSAATTRSWMQWIVPLQAFADQGINLSNVDKIAIGLGSKSGSAAPGGSGTIYVDDIRLCQP